MSELNVRAIYGTTFECGCGRTHEIEPREVLCADGALSRLGEICDRHAAGRDAAVIADVRTRAVAGDAAAADLTAAGRRVEMFTVGDRPGGHSPICDDVTFAQLAPRIAGKSLVLSVGSGVINDLGKWLAFEAGIPFVTVATAASMNGYTSSNIAPTLKGVKSLMSGRAAAAVLAEPSIISDAPYEMTAAGLGDVLAKSVSSADWLANHLLFGDYYCPRAVGLIAEIEPLYLEHPRDLRARKPAAVDALFEALLLTGAAMTMAGSSAPASGGEHLLSHALDMMASLEGVEHDLHGKQVGLGTILASEVYRRLLAEESPDWTDAPANVDQDFWGALAAQVVAQYAEKRPRLTAAREQLSRGNAWDDLRARLAPMVRPPEQLRDCLAAAGAAWRAEDIGCSPQRIRAALLRAHEIRSRFTVLDLANLAGVMPAAAGEIIEQWA